MVGCEGTRKHMVFAGSEARGAGWLLYHVTG